MIKQLVKQRFSVWFIAIVLLSVGSGCSSLSSGSIVAVTPLPDKPLSAPTPTVVETMAETEASAAVLAPTSSSLETPATPTPLTIDLSKGTSAAIAAATDVAFQPTVEARLLFEESPVPITFDEFYDGYNMRTGLLLSPKLVSLDGQQVVMEGYMAPPLKPDIDWFVLTSVRLEFCPFCSSDADWPSDTAVIYLMNHTIGPTTKPVRLV